MTAPKIMVVENAGPLCVLLEQTLEAEGYQVEILTHGGEAATRIRSDFPDLLILDPMVPGVSDAELFQQLRKRAEAGRLPIIVLTDDSARTRGTSWIEYLIKPISESELIICVRALLKRTKPEVLSDVLTVQDVLLDRRQHQVFRQNKPIPLAPTEFKLLHIMMQNPGYIFSRQELVEGIWGNSEYGQGRALDVAIVRLRKSLNAISNVDLIKTVRGAGYAIGG